jgi:type I restriction enzyme R subunit
VTANRFNEDQLVERPAMALLDQLGYETINAYSETLGPAGTLGRDSQHDAFLTHRLRDALSVLNPSVPESVREEALAEVVRDRSAMLAIRANQAFYELIRNGYRAQWQDHLGDMRYATVRYVDFNDSAKNDWLAVNQFRLIGPLHNRRTDAVLFVNGIPLVLFEFKNTPDVSDGFRQNITDYRDTIPHLFWPNAFVIVSNGAEAKVGSTYAKWDFFKDWKLIDADGNRGAVALETAIRGTCTHDYLLDLVENFITYTDLPRETVKAVAQNHQFLGVNAAIENLHRVRAAGDKRLGVFWHTQGSGKSLSMLWFAEKILRRLPGKWTFVMVTDRTELDTQLHNSFVRAGAVGDTEQVHADSAAHLRDLLQADHRYVFTLIHKFRIDKTAGETEMPVLSERDDIIVITDEAHRSQYDTLALNMRQALPNASFMGFTGTPLMAGEELTRQEFGDYVSTYNFRDAIADGATVPLFYENRVPELQLTNDDFTDELEEILEAAELDDDAEGQLIRKFAQLHQFITRPERLRTIARDLVRHFVGRGFTGKAMYVGIDKAAAVEMFQLVQDEWAVHLAELRVEHDALPEPERPWLASRIELMETTDMAVVVSQSQNELQFFDRLGFDIRPHRQRMNTEALDEKFKDPDDPLRIVFVCAMWMTGFDAPSVSTIYLDRPMRNHTLMQTIARANRVFPDKDNGLIVDYINVFGNLEKALAIYGAANAEVDSPIQDKSALVATLAASVTEVAELCAGHGVDLDALWLASGLAFVDLRNAAVEALIADHEVKASFLTGATVARKLFKAVLPDPAANEWQARVAVIRVLADWMTGLGRPHHDIGHVVDAVDALLDRSVGAEEYIIRAAAEDGVDDPLADPRIDLSKIDFEALAARFGGRKLAQTERLAAILRGRAERGAAINPTRMEFVERIEELIAMYNAGSVNADEYLRRLIALSGDLTVEESRAVTEGMTEEQLAIFDILTRPDPTLTADERAEVRESARELLEHLHDKLVLDWRRKAASAAKVREAIKAVLDSRLPVAPYTPEIFDAKVAAIFDHIAKTAA